MTLDEVKKYLRVDGDDDDDMISMLLVTAKSYITINTGFTGFDAGDDLATVSKLGIGLLVVHWYENREPAGKADMLKHSLDSILFSLRWTPPTPGGEGGGTA